MSPTRLGRYEVLYEIGDGSMGRVYKAWDPVLSRIVAVKAVKSEYLTHNTATEYLRRFRREAQAAGRLSHPTIVRVFDVGFDFLVMELVEGRTLQDVLRDHGRFEPEDVVALLAPVADAIDYAHRTGVIHRDIKPGNIIVQPCGQPKLMDFGVAHLETSIMTTAGAILGSPSYMSPEQIAGFEVTPSTDVYALAVVAYEMLTGQAPFHGGITQVIYQVMHEVPAAPRLRNTALPERYDEVFARALHKDVAQRFPTAADFIAAVALRDLEPLLVPGLDLPAASQPAAAPSASGGGRGWYEHVETVASRPGRAKRMPRPDVRVRATTVAALSLLAILAVAVSVLPGATQPSVLSANAAPVMACGDAPRVLESGSRIAAVKAARLRTWAQPREVLVSAAAQATRTAETPSLPLPPAPSTASPLTGAGPSVASRAPDPGADVTPPRRIAGTTVYPQIKGRERANGTVAIEMIVDEQGVPKDLNVVISAGPALDAAALESVRSWRFDPARQNGVPVRVRWLARQTYLLAP